MNTTKLVSSHLKFFLKYDLMVPSNVNFYIILSKYERFRLKPPKEIKMNILLIKPRNHIID